MQKDNKANVFVSTKAEHFIFDQDNFKLCYDRLLQVYFSSEMFSSFLSF